MPDISVAITTYNQALWIGDALESVLRQSSKPAEVVVVDDGSTDGTPDVLDRFRGRIRTIRQKNAGVAAARNAAVLACSSDFVALLDGDDLWHPEKIRRCTELLKSYGGPSLLAHDVRLISPGGTMIGRGEIGGRLAGAGREEATVLDCLEPLIDGNFIWTTSQVVVRRSAYIDAGLSDPSFPIASDYDLYLRLAARGPFLLASDVLTQWRRHDATTSGHPRGGPFSSAIDMARVLTKARTLRELSDRTDAIDRRFAGIVGLVYGSQSRFGRQATAQALARIAWHCRDIGAAVAAGAVLLAPRRIRRVVASVTGISISRGIQF
jgi:glycosyltransferase involved in cell wall biosynthesis